MKNDDIVTDVTKWRRGWKGGLPETPCGFGSKESTTRIQRAALDQWMLERRVKSVVDIGAGDLNWALKMDLAGLDYRPLDIVVRHRLVEPFDLLKDPIPQADMIWCIWVLNHFAEADARRALAKLITAPAHWLVMTWECRMFDFLDVPAQEKAVIRPASQRSRAAYGDVELRLIHLPSCR